MKEKRVISNPELEASIKKLVEKKQPGDLISMGWALATLPEGDLDALDRLEEEFGEEACNDWLAAVMESTGLYEVDGTDAKTVRLLTRRAPAAS